MILNDIRKQINVSYKATDINNTYTNYRINCLNLLNKKILLSNYY